jgi:PPK2 family polyphosphate:nucleotide phosphotransferase
MQPAKLLAKFRVAKPARFRLGGFDCADTLGIGKGDAQALLAYATERLAELQGRLYADHRWAVLVVLQGMDAAGKDSAVKHVMAGLNPLGCHAHAFKAPSDEELDHDYLWRVARRLPPRGSIGIFNRSHYEEVLAVRVQPELLRSERIPPQYLGKDIWPQRFEDICAFERHLVHNGTLVLKFFLHISHEEQRERLLARLDDPAKRWKFSADDLAKRRQWNGYMAAYEDMIRHTSKVEAPWFVVPADHKWFAHLVIATAVVEALQQLKLKYPSGPPRSELQRLRKAL